jgi:hypothetical protein
MDYDYDHLKSGTDSIQPMLDLCINQAESELDAKDAYPTWLEAAVEIRDHLVRFPDAGEMDHLGRVRKAVAICKALEGADVRAIPPERSFHMVLTLQDALRDECEAMERYMGIHTPHELLHPSSSVASNPDVEQSSAPGMGR